MLVTEDPALVDRIDAVLPQTQCRQCGYDGCRPYARAIAGGIAPINQCPPGGEAGVARLAAVVGCMPVPLDTTRGATKPLEVALIDESLCIGCTLCIQACPVDAIVGAGKRMHAVVAELCTGCELCVAPCPVDCIRMIDAGHTWDDDHAAMARTHHATRNARIARLAAARASSPIVARSVDRDAARRQAIVAGAIERARAIADRRRVAGKPAAGRPS